MPLFPESEAQASFLKETIVKRERTGGISLLDNGSNGELVEI